MRWWGHTRWGLRYRGHVIYHPAKTYHPAKILDGGTIQDGKHHPKGYGMAEEVRDGSYVYRELECPFWIFVFNLFYNLSFGFDKATLLIRLCCTHPRYQRPQ